MGPLWLEAFQFHRWANLMLLDACASLTDDQLQHSSPGTYGNIADTLQHLVAAEQRYLKQLGGGEPQLTEHDAFAGVPRLTLLAAQSGEALLAIAGNIKPDDTYERLFQERPMRVASGVVAIQALHHGNDHRTHVCTILGQNDIPTPEIDVWAYGRTHGLIVPIDTPGATG